MPDVCRANGMSEEKSRPVDVVDRPEAVASDTRVGGVTASVWKVQAHPGGAWTEWSFVAGDSIGAGEDADGDFWILQGPGENDVDSRFHASRDALEPGWYELTGHIDCIAGEIALPALFHGLNEERQFLLPVPDAQGAIRAMLLFLDPVSHFGFAASVESARFRLRDFRLRRLSKGAALRHMLGGGLEKHATGRFRRLVRFAAHASRVGPSQAASALYRGYVKRVREQALAGYKARASDIASEEIPEEKGGQILADDVLTPYVHRVAHVNDTVDLASSARLLEHEVELLAESGLFDPGYYLGNNPDVARAGFEPLLHYCQHGWRSLRNPAPGFDVWWYWANHLEPARALINPLVHYALRGRELGLSTRPPAVPRFDKGHAFAQGKSIRRICLFAGYDPDGIVDDCVVDYVRELARHADVYYLSDGDMRPGELDKLAGVTRGAWAVRHGAYDFGSYAMLARDLVGWEVIETCDELIFANDSGYLLRPLDEVFARMDAKPCDWWGLQATKGVSATRNKPANQFRQPIPMQEVVDRKLAEYEEEYFYDFHVGSYFLAFRAPVISDAGFRKLIDGVIQQGRKLNIVRKYEIGITRHLIGYGHVFETYIDSLYPFHPVYSESAFELVKQGFPLFKRYFLAHNLYSVPGLLDWKERLQQAVPEAPVEKMERNLERVSDYRRLYHNLRIGKDWRGRPRVVSKPLDNAAFAKADAACEKHDDWWAFPTCAFTDTFSGNERAIFEVVKHDASIKKIVLVRRRHVLVDGENVVVVPLESREGQYYLMRARQMFIKHSPTRNLVYPVSPSLHNVINVWHGIPLKRIGHASLDMQDKLEALGQEHAKCRAVISSSKVDTMAMACAFYPLSYNDVWKTGLPRNDFILRDEDALPADFGEQLSLLRDMLQGQQLVLFVPTFKHAQANGYYHFSDAELDRLAGWLGKHNAVLGVREHMADKAHTYFSMLAGIGAIDLGNRWFPNVEVLYREAALLITDYSSSFIDFMLTGKPMLSFAYDYDNYVNEERGLFYDLDQVFPGAVCRNFEQLAEAMESVPMDGGARPGREYLWKRELFFDYLDDGNADRVVSRVKALGVGADEDRE